jgi:hypothetical protein
MLLKDDRRNTKGKRGKERKPRREQRKRILFENGFKRRMDIQSFGPWMTDTQKQNG